MTLRLFILLSFNSFTFCVNSQIVELPSRIGYDSVVVKQYKEHISDRFFYKNGKKKLRVEYSMAIPDSIYTYIEGNISIKVIFTDTIVQYDSYNCLGDTSFRMKFTMNQKILEKGNYYLIKELDGLPVRLSRKYKIGKWYDAKLGEVDYDEYKINDINISKILGPIYKKYKEKSDRVVKKIYGSKFTKKYIRFNMDKSTISRYSDNSPGFARSGNKLTRPLDSILYCDFTYNIVIGNKRYNVIELRIDSNYEFVGRISYKHYGSRVFYMTKGLDINNEGVLHSSVLDWEKTAVENDFNINSKDFNTGFYWVKNKDSEFYGSLTFIIEEIIEVNNSDKGVLTANRQLEINPWTGESEFNMSQNGIVIDE